MKVLYSSVECYPFIKTGGLGDVAYSLPRALKNLDIDIKVFLIFNNSIKEKYKEKMKKIYSISLNLNEKIFHVEIFSYFLDGIEYLFLKDARTANIERTAYLDLQEDPVFYLIFNKAIATYLDLSNFNPDIIHINDWHTGILPLFLAKEKQKNNKLKTIFTIHNLQYQGAFGSKRILEYLDENQTKNSNLNEIVGYDIFNFMKAGIVLSDYVTTVSETYKEEIKHPMFGMGLEALLNKYDYKLEGIINGLDDDIFNPSKDEYIYTKYNIENFPEAKRINKLALQKELNLESNKEIFLIGVVSRLANQKGIDLILNSLWKIMEKNDVQFVILGTGDVNYENSLSSFAKQYPKNFKFLNKFSNEMSHKIYAGVDALLIPSLFEPCGLTQLISFKYGVVPIARKTGGLADTIIPYDKKNSNGFLFKDFTPQAFNNSIDFAKKIYYEKKQKWNELIVSGMNQKFDWIVIAKKYIESVYKK